METGELQELFSMARTTITTLLWTNTYWINTGFDGEILAFCIQGENVIVKVSQTEHNSEEEKYGRIANPVVHHGRSMSAKAHE